LDDLNYQSGKFQLGCALLIFLNYVEKLLITKARKNENTKKKISCFPGFVFS